jgi:hypothetical protein
MTDLPTPAPSDSPPSAPDSVSPADLQRRVFRDPRAPRFAPPWVGGVAFLVVVMLVIAGWWWAHHHMMAASLITLAGGHVSWDWSNGNWQHGGSTTVDFSAPANALKDTDLEPLPRLHRVVSVNLERCTGVSDEGLSVLGKLPYLEELDLQRPMGGSSGLARPTRITDATLKVVGGLHKLRVLNLSGTAISDAGLQELKGLKDLEFLDVSDTSVSDEGLLALKGLTRLRTLVVDSPKVTAPGTAGLLKTIPNLDIQHPLVPKNAP